MTTTNNTFATTLLNTSRGIVRSVTFRLDNIAAPGVVWTRTARRRVVELTSYDGNAVEVYIHNEDGLPMYVGTIADYAPANKCDNTTVRTFAKVWFANQKSAVARKAFTASATHPCAA